jgi:hypothetical protein
LTSNTFQTILLTSFVVELLFVAMYIFLIIDARFLGEEYRNSEIYKKLKKYIRKKIFYIFIGSFIFFLLYSVFYPIECSEYLNALFKTAILRK